MNVLILAISDWAGLGNLLTQCLCRVGVDAKFYCVNKGSYKHPIISINKKQAIKFSKVCDIIQYMHSAKPNIDIDLTNKKIVVFHGGGRFRDNPKHICQIFNPVVDCSLIQTYDLFGLGAKNEKWLLPPMNTKKLKPVYKTKGQKIIVGHFPSSVIGKGSDTIHKIINSIKNEVLDFEYRFSKKRVPWEQQIKRMSEVDIYIERMSLKKNTKNGWKKTGVWGMTALEAAALGKIVVTNFYGHEIYKKEYGKCYLQTANSEDDMRDILINLLSKNKQDLLKLKMKTRNWVEHQHSFKSIGKRLKGIYEEL